MHLFGVKAAVKPAPGRAVAIFQENSRRLSRYNHDRAMVLVFGGEHSARPEPPALLTLKPGEEAPYAPPPQLQATGAERPVIGRGPDRWGYYLAAAGDYPVGGIYSAPDGGIYVRVETPAITGGFEPRWVRAT